MPQNPQIAAFVTAQTQYNNEIGASIDGLVSDIATLNETIEELQNTPPVLDPADQALLDELTTQGAALAARIKAADELTPPTPPEA